MKHLFSPLLGVSLLLAAPAEAQDLTNAGATITVQAGAALYVGTGGLTNASGGTLTNAGTLRVDGPTTNAGTLDLGAGTLEVKGDLTSTGTLVPGTSPVTFSGAADQLLTPGGATFYQLLLNKPTAGANTLRLAANLTVSNQLSLSNGLISTKNGTVVSTLRLPNGATLSGEAAGRYVLGALEITRNAVSGAAVNFGHGAVLNPTTNNLGTVVITRVAGLLTDDVSRGVNFANAAYKGIDRIWTVVPAAQPAAGSPAQLTLSWLADNDNGLADFTQARIFGQTATGQPWAVRGPVTNASARSLTASFATLARFSVSNAASPLPVTLLDFAARAEGPAAVRLAWTTAMELNNAGFTVERSRDARTFAAIGTVAGAGTSTTRHDYTLLDSQLPTGATLFYYRLRQTDVSGDFSYSPVRAVALTAQAAGFVVYPTRVPVGETATYLHTGPSEPATLLVLDLLGRVVRTAQLDGRAQGEVPLAGLASGSYLLRYTSATARFGARCVEMSDVVWGLHASSATLPEVLVHMRDHAYEVLPPASLAVDFAVTDEVATLTPSVAVCQTLYLIYKEALHNAVKHARGATQVTIRLSQQAGLLCLRVADNAPGPAPVTRPGGRGLANMRQRAETVGGTLHLSAGVMGFGVEACLPG